MTDPAGGPAELRGLVGRTTAWAPFTVAPGEVADFRAAVGAEEEESIPPTFFCPDPLVVAEALGLSMPRPFPRRLDGGSSWEWVAPLAIGRRYRRRAAIVGITAKQGSAATGAMMLTTVEVTCADEAGATVGRCRGVSISYQGPDR